VQLYHIKGGNVSGQDLVNIGHLENLTKGKNTMAKEKQSPQRTTATEALGRTPFYPELEKRHLTNLLDTQFLLEDVRYISNWTSRFGNHPLVLLKGSIDQQQFTTICSGQVVVSKCQELAERSLLPCFATIVYNDTYYDII